MYAEVSFTPHFTPGVTPRSSSRGVELAAMRRGQPQRMSALQLCILTGIRNLYGRATREAIRKFVEAHHGHAFDYGSFNRAISAPVSGLRAKGLIDDHPDGRQLALTHAGIGLLNARFVRQKL